MLRPGGSGTRRALTPLTRHLCLFFLLNSVVLNVLLAALPWTPERKTALNYSARFLVGRARTDSWGQLGVALDQFRSSPDRPLYSEVFLHRQIRFPYAPPSLLPTAALRAVRLWTPGFLNLVSWVAVWATVGVTILLLSGVCPSTSRAMRSPGASRRRSSARSRSPFTRSSRVSRSARSRRGSTSSSPWGCSHGWRVARRAGSLALVCAHAAAD